MVQAYTCTTPNHRWSKVTKTLVAFPPPFPRICQVFCWRSCNSSVRQCRWAYGRQVFMADAALSKNGMMFVTQEGEGFSGVWAGEYKKYGEKKGEEEYVIKPMQLQLFCRLYFLNLSWHSFILIINQHYLSIKKFFRQECVFYELNSSVFLKFFRGQCGGLWPFRCRNGVWTNPPGKTATRPSSRQCHHGF